MRFTYQTGAQPLAGYTIQRGIHRGGFGEVYYANSDGGKEVAIKLLHPEDQDVEIRGVTQCLNLKHPNLVNLFDVKKDDGGDCWIVMEYVAGSSLEDVLASFPNGLPLPEVRDWLNGLVSGVTHLHERGIVHRDLKPANVYRENGVVKVGDVGLSKRLDSDHRRHHTQSVGTVYYMAPEVAHGQYGPEVDVYSLGVMLYEMITGKLPFNGETTAEVLMKHLTAQPDLSPIPVALRPMMARALEKDPRKRTPTVRQLEHEFQRAMNSPEPLTIPESAFVRPPPGTNGNGHAEQSPWISIRVNSPVSKQEPPKNRPQSDFRVPAIRPWSQVLPELGHSLGFAAVVASLLSTAISASPFVSTRSIMPSIEHAVFFAATSVVGSWMLLIGHAWTINSESMRRHRWLLRLATGALIGVAAYQIDRFLLADVPQSAYLYSSSISTLRGNRLLEQTGSNPTLLGYVCFFASWLGIRSWSRDMNPFRKKRLSAALTIAAVVVALLVTRVFAFPQWYALLWAATLSTTVQLASVWTPRKPLSNIR